MNYGRAFNQYKDLNIQTAGKLELVIICYENAILCLRQAKDHFKDREIEQKAAKIQTALSIIGALQSNLDFDKGDKIAKGLDSLYSYITKRIILADIQKDFQVFDECINILTELKSAWEGISKTKEDHTPVKNAADPNVKGFSQIAA